MKELATRREFISGAAGILLLSFVPWTKAWGAQVVEVRMWPSPEYTRLTLEHDVPMKFRYFMLRVQRPLRMAVDVEGLLLTESLKKIVNKVNPQDPYVQSINVAQNNPKTVRITITFKTDVDPQVFSLKPFGNYKYRLVFDIYPAEQKDPLMAIIQKEESEPDAIGRLLAEVAEGQKRMEENRQEAENDSIGDLIAGITSGNLAPMKPEPAPKATTPAKPAPAKPKSPPTIAKAPAPVAPPVQKNTPEKTSPKRGRVLVIAVDPGHGGEDPGAIGKTHKTREKDVVLAIARILVRELNNVSGFKAVLTRDGDYFVPLQRRVQKARAAKADFFVSVHADAWIKSTAKGSSIFALNSKGQVSSSNRWLANNQNNADLIGGVNVSSHDKQVAKILLDMSFTAQISDSLSYGRKLLSEMQKINKLHKNNVEQANFAVLKAPDIPSVLVETAFLSNPEEEKKLRTAAFQKKMACAIGTGILRCFGRTTTLK
ncbi:MAG: N-acetylmuramoyl-L-alanine amidase [Burkholderiales bacterium]|nr:N-acetylmuramoyl-L-alanine amidase [Burkholderiales bacterium]